MTAERPDVEIESLSALDAVLSLGQPLRGLRLQDLDLRGHEAQLLARDDLAGLVVLGGHLTAELDAHLRAHRALIFPTDPNAPVDPYRASLYHPDELYAGLLEHGYERTPDARAHQWSRDASLGHDAFVTLLRAIHDDSVSDALTDALGTAPVVGVMGGHALERGTGGYADAARLGRRLAGSGLVVVTGGGPGAMEAANLGAFCDDDDLLDEALTALGDVPSFRPSITSWAALALRVRARVRRGSGSGRITSVGIPTWFYGHEPPNVFCDGIAKYFSNAIREDGLLARATAGLVVLEGAAGTAQEVFQAATPLYYAGDAALPPLVLVGRRHWTETVPLWPALQALGRGTPLGTVLHLVDDPAEAAAVVVGRSHETS